MSAEKMREDFNLWYDSERKKSAPFSTVDIRARCFEAWQASRAAIEVDLERDDPADEGAAYLHQDFVKERIESLGLKVKP